MTELFREINKADSVRRRRNGESVTGVTGGVTGWTRFLQGLPMLVFLIRFEEFSMQKTARCVTGVTGVTGSLQTFTRTREREPKCLALKVSPFISFLRKVCKTHVTSVTPNGRNKQAIKRLQKIFRKEENSRILPPVLPGVGILSRVGHRESGRSVLLHPFHLRKAEWRTPTSSLPPASAALSEQRQPGRGTDRFPLFRRCRDTVQRPPRKIFLFFFEPVPRDTFNRLIISGSDGYEGKTKMSVFYKKTDTGSKITTKCRYMQANQGFFSKKFFTKSYKSDKLLYKSGCKGGGKSLIHNVLQTGVLLLIGDGHRFGEKKS